MITLLKFFLIFSITAYLVLKLCNVYNLINSTKIYLNALNNLKSSLNKKKSIDEIQKELNKVSLNGIRLLINLILFILPYIFCIIFLNFINISIPLKINFIISIIPYLVLLKK